MATIEIPEGFTIKVNDFRDECRIQFYLFDYPVYAVTYPFPSTSELKLKSAIADAKRDFANKLSKALVN